MEQRLTEAVLLATYRATVDDLYGWVSRRCGGDRALAEDVTQETWLRAVRTWREDGLPRKPLAWLRTVARNALLNQLRQRQPMALESVPADELMRAVAMNQVTESTDVAAAVHGALGRLPRSRSRLLELYHFDGLHVAQIAARLGITERAAEGRLRRARQSLRRELQPLAEAEGEHA